MMIVVAGSATLLAACGGGSGNSADNGGTSCTPKGAGSGTAAQTVKINSDPTNVGAFAPATISVKKGDTVEWDWVDSGAQHSVTSDDNTTFDSCLQGAGSKFVVTFSTAGDYKYHCTIHSGMVGDVKVS
jgi:plastocyanin